MLYNMIFLGNFFERLILDKHFRIKRQDELQYGRV